MRLTVLAGDQRRHLGRQEPGELGPLAIDRRQEASLFLDRRAFEVAEPLLAHRGLDPGSEDLGRDGLGQVVGCAHLDAADDAVELIDPGDDDDRQVPQRVVGLERRQRLVAVHDRHDDVQQDDVDRLRSVVAQHRERLATVRRLDGRVTDVGKQPDEQSPVERRVVDDQDAAAGHGAPPAGAVALGAAAVRAAPRASGRIGLEM